MGEELGELKRKYRELYLAENKPSHLESVLARYDQSIQMWLDKSQQINEALRNTTKPDDSAARTNRA
jgi:hypothetical protein